MWPETTVSVLTSLVANLLPAEILLHRKAEVHGGLSMPRVNEELISRP